MPRCAAYLHLLLSIIALSDLAEGVNQESYQCIHDRIAEQNPHIVNIAGQSDGHQTKRQTSTDYSNIRIHSVPTNIAFTARPHIFGNDTTLSRAINILESILMVHPVEGNFVVPPQCTEYTSGPNEGKCNSPLPDDNSYGCGPYGFIPNEYIGNREVCPTFSGPCYLDGSNGTGIPNTDYLLFVSAASTFNCIGGVLAYASSCMLDMGDNYRPVAGYINICPSSLDDFSEDILLGIVVHEIIHALGFSRSLYDRYVDENGNNYNATMTVDGPYGVTNQFTGPRTVELARSYYSCETIEGLSLENEGGGGTASSHWEKRTLHHELMNGYVSSDYLVLSEFTAALFEDSGWYRANYSALSALDQHELQWGKGLGCSFLTERCVNRTVYPYLCDTNNNQMACTFDHLSKGRCSSSWNGFDGCPIEFAVESTDYCRSELATATYDEIEDYSSNSICVDGIRSINYDCGTAFIQPVFPLCVSQETYLANDTYSYVVHVQGTPYGCSDGYAVVTDSNWTLLCPPTEEVVLQSSLVINDELPDILAPPMRIMADDLNELGSMGFLIDQDIVVFGGLQFENYIVESFIVNLFGNDPTTICLVNCSTCFPIPVEDNNTITLETDELYAIRSGTLVVSIFLIDIRTQSTPDYSLVLMLNPQASHSFVYYSISVDFVGDYLQSLHSNDHNTFIVTALARNTEVRISPSNTVTVNGISIVRGEEYVLQLDEGQSLWVYGSEDLTGSRITSNKATSVYSGHMCAEGSSTNCSILIEQIPPYNSWGNNFLLHANVSDIRGNIFKIVASDAGANVSTNCTSDGIVYESGSIYLGFREAVTLLLNHSYCTVSSAGRILIIQFRDSLQQASVDLDTYMTIVPAVTQFKDRYVFNAYYSNSFVGLVVREMDPSNTPLLLNDVPVSDLIWQRVNLDGMSYFYGTLALPLGRNELNFISMTIEFGAIIYGYNEMDTYALAAGMSLELEMDLPLHVSSPVQEASLTVVDDMINVTWEPPATPNGVIYQYIVRQITPNDTSYHYVSGNEYSILLPFFNVTNIFITAVNFYGHSDEEFAESSIDACFPSPCFNGGTCVVTQTSFECHCDILYVGLFCETGELLYPFGLSQNDSTLAMFRDTTASVLLMENFYFYNNFFRFVYVGDNGIISLESPYNPNTPNSFPINFRYIIAPYWADVDLRGTGQVYYRQTTDPALLLTATNQIRAAFPASQNQTITTLLIVTWDSVGYYASNTDKRNTFQCILSLSSEESFVTFIYDDIQWTTGDRSGGNDGLGGTEALAGINAGDGNNSITIPGSLTPDILNITETSNVGIPGVWMFRVGEVIYTVNIITSPSGYPVDLNNNIFEYFTETDLSLTCSVIPSPPSNSKFIWGCSTGCFADMQMEQTINVTLSNVTDGGVLNCSVVINGVQYFSESFEVQVIDDDFCQSENITCVTEFYSFGPTTNDASLHTSSVDASSPPIVLSQSFTFYGQTISTAYVGDNGIVSLTNTYNFWTPGPLPIDGPQFITPFWADVDLTGTGQVYYRQTNDTVLLARANNEIQAAFAMSENVNITNLLIVTWDAVGYYSGRTDKTNTFQCVLATSAVESFVIFLYADQRIQWTTGDDSGGVNGLGGTEALAGINAGDGVNFVTIPGSLTPDIINITETSNVGISGVWMFRVDQATNYAVNVVADPRGNPIPGSTNAFEYLAGTDLILNCSVTPRPPSVSEFSWSCSTGCFADMQMEQTINVTALDEMDSGVINCSVVINETEYFSEPFELQVMTVTYVTTIITVPAVNPIPGSNNTFGYFAGTDLTLTCLVAPTPLFDSEFNWNCSTGCFADMEMNQTIQVTDLEEMDSGVITCSVSINGMEYVSESIELVIIEVPNIRISVDPLGIPVPGQGSGGGPGSGFGSTYTFQYFVGADLNLSCLATPPPPIDIPYRWICSTGCFADMETTQNISVMGLNVSDSGSIFCGVNLIGVDFFSQSFGLQVIMMVTFNATIITIPTVDPIPGSNNTFEYFAGTDLFLTCSVTPDPPFGSQYNWNCSTGCFADMEMERTIQVTDLEEMDSGVVSCSVSVYGMEYVSESIEIAVIEAPNISILIDPVGEPVPGSTNVFQYVAGTGLSLSCLVNPPPPSDSEFSWSCSTGCFADMEMTQNISVMSLDITDSGVLNCVVNINGAELVSEPIGLQILMMDPCQPENGTCTTNTKLYPFGSSQNDAVLPEGDDVISRTITLSENFIFYGETVSTTSVGDNGIISLQDTRYNHYTPMPLPLTQQLTIIAPYWSDVDNRGTGQVFYRQTNDPVLVARVANELQSANLSQNEVITNLFIATWNAVGYYSRHTDKTNTYQCILATSEYASFVIFVYADIQWTTGDASGGTNGLGGTEALAGINAGDRVNSVTIPGSLTPDILNITETSNVGIPGVWMFTVGEVLTVAFSMDQYTVMESVGYVEIGVTLSGRPSTDPVTVVIIPLSLSASGLGIDFDSNAFNITFEAGENFGSYNLSITCDKLIEGEEIFYVTLTSDDPQITINDDTALVAIIDSTIVVNFDQSSYNVSEDESIVMVELIMNQPSSRQFEVIITLMSITTTDMEDYNQTRITVDVPAGVLSQSFTIDVIDDDIVECDEMFNVMIEPVATCEVAIGNLATTEITIIDNDVSVVSLEQSDYVVVNKGRPLSVSIVLSDTTSQDVIVEVVVTDGTATSGIDYNVTNGVFNVTIPAGGLSSSFSIDIIDDTIQENNETFNIAIRLVPSCLSLSVGTASSTVTIVDNDEQDLVVCFSESQLNVTEDQGSAMIVLTLTVPSPFDISVTVISTNGSALGSVDYDPGPYTVTIPAGQTSSSFNIQIYDDNVFETDEMFTLSIDGSSLPATVEEGPDCVLRVTILDNDGIVVSFEQMTYNIDEDNGPVQPVLVLSNPSSTTVTIEVLSMDESATGNTDYNSEPYTVIFSPGVIRYQFDVLIVDDNILENDETFRLSINASSLIRGVTVGSVDQATVNIFDEDAVTIEFTQVRYNSTEDTGILQVTIEMIGGTVNIPVDVTVTPSEQSPPSAQGDIDFSTAPLTVTFTSGMTMNTANVIILPDTIVESNEMFDLSISVPPLFNGRLSAGNRVNAIGVIVDPTSCVVDDDCTNDFGDFCQVECPANSYPPHTTLLQEPISFNGNTFTVVSANRQPDFSGQITFFAKFSQMQGNSGFLVFYGIDSTNINFAIQIDSSSNEDVTLLTIYSYSNGMYTVSPLSLGRRIDDGVHYCLTIVFDTPVLVYIDGDLVPGTPLTLRNIDFTFGLTESNPASLLVGGVPPNMNYFQGEIVQIVIFNGFLDVNSLDYDATILEYSNTMSAVCSLLDSNYVRYGKCRKYLTRGEVCPPPITQTSELCVSDLDRCDPSLRCFPDILGRHTCQYVPPICTKDDDCIDDDYFCGEEQPAYTSVGYLEPASDIISGNKTTYISTPTKFDALMIIKRPGTDHPDLDNDLTIFTILQQDVQNNGYVIAKGTDRINRDWALYLQSPQNQIILSYRTIDQRTNIITFSDLEFGDGEEHTIAAVISGIKSIADNEIGRALLYIDGVLVGVQEQIAQPKFQPGLNFLYIGGTPEASESARDRFSGTITYLAVYNTALSYGEIAQLTSNVKNSFSLERYCKEYVQPGGYCYIGDTGEYRCMPPARCAPIVKNNLIVTTPFASNGQIMSQSFHLTADLPKSGSRFDVTSIIGRCVSPCSCVNNDLSNKVCGADGRTYDSECDARCAGISVVDSSGPCSLSYAELYRRMQGA